MRLSASPLVKPLLTFLSSLVLLRAFAMDSLFLTNTQPTGTSPAASASSAWADVQLTSTRSTWARTMAIATPIHLRWVASAITKPVQVESGIVFHTDTAISIHPTSKLTATS